MSINPGEVTHYSEWEGPDGVRRTGIGIVQDYTPEEISLWMNAVNLPPRLPGETWHQWAERTGEQPIQPTTEEERQQ